MAVEPSAGVEILIAKNFRRGSLIFSATRGILNHLLFENIRREGFVELAVLASPQCDIIL